MTTEDKKIEGHAYDGIEELDNSLPQWWLLTFYGTIVFAAAYFLYYSIGNGPTLQQEFHQDQRENVALQMQSSKNVVQVDESGLLAISKNPERQAAGKEIFGKYCVACHGAVGQGGIGPNLTDDYWLHGSKPSQILKTITSGVEGTAMQAWGNLLKPEEIQSAMAYVKSIRGSNPPGAKAPQGELVKE